MIYFMFVFFFWDTVPFQLCKSEGFIKFIKIIRFIILAFGIIYFAITLKFKYPIIPIYMVVSFISQFHLVARYLLSYAGIVLFNLPVNLNSKNYDSNELLRNAYNIMSAYIFVTICLDFLIYCHSLEKDNYCENNNKFVETCKLQYDEVISSQAQTAGKD
jgi:hypothetical protein